MNQNFDKFNEIQQEHKSVYLGSSKKQKKDNVLESQDHHGTSVGAEGRNVINKNKD